MDPSQLNKVNSLNQSQHYQNVIPNIDNNIEQPQTGNNTDNNYQQAYYEGAISTGMIIGTQNNLSPRNSNLIGVNTFPQGTYEHYEQGGIPGISNTNNTNTSLSPRNKNTHFLSDENADKPWARAAKDPSLIQKGTEVFVGNLAIDTNEIDLYEAFKECGEIIDIRVHKNVQNKKCYAFIRFLTKDMLKNALNKNLISIKGRKIKVTKSNENSTIFIGNIRKNWTNQDVDTKVRRIFPNCEKIEHFSDPNNANKNRGFCFVVFKNRNEAIKALNYVSTKGGINIDGVPLTCDWADVVDEDDSNSRQIFVAGLDDSVEESTLREVFSKYGHITDIVMSKMHKTSKRKDLAFITFENNQAAKNAVDSFRATYKEDDHVMENRSYLQETITENLNNAGLGENYFEGFDNESIETKMKMQTPTNYKPNPLGSHVNVSLAFSQQAMQTKKKIKESRKKVGGGAHANISNITQSTLRNPVSPTIPQAAVPQTINPPQNTAVPAQNNINAAAMLAMMNLINMNKSNVNINPALMTQMMTACFESIINQNLTPNTASANNLNNITNLSALNTLNTTLNPSNSNLNPLQTINLGKSNKKNKRLKKISKKKRPNASLNANNSQNSA